MNGKKLHETIHNVGTSESIKVAMAPEKKSQNTWAAMISRPLFYHGPRDFP